MNNEKVDQATMTMIQIMKAIARATESGIKEVLHFADAKITIEPNPTDEGQKEGRG